MRLVRSSGRSLGEIAGDFGVPEQTLRNWVFAPSGLRQVIERLARRPQQHHVPPLDGDSRSIRFA